MWYEYKKAEEYRGYDIELMCDPMSGMALHYRIQTRGKYSSSSGPFFDKDKAIEDAKETIDEWIYMGATED